MHIAWYILMPSFGTYTYIDVFKRLKSEAYIYDSLVETTSPRYADNRWAGKEISYLFKEPM